MTPEELAKQAIMNHSICHQSEEEWEADLYVEMSRDNAVKMIADAIAAAVLAEREVLQPIIDLWQFIRENGTCFSGHGNRPCRLNESDDPKEYCLYHKAWAIEARTAQGEGE